MMPCSRAAPMSWRAPGSTGEAAEFATPDGHQDYRTAVPARDHFIPALYLAGLAGAPTAGDTEALVDGYAYGSLSTTA
jgi:4,5-DOPA dioxygenase extradiol